MPYQQRFTFDYVFGIETRQDEIFEGVGKHLIDKFLEGGFETFSVDFALIALMGLHSRPLTSNQAIM